MRLLLWLVISGMLLAQEAGSSRVNPKDGLAYVWIPPGHFTMGCSPGDPECDRSNFYEPEKPHPVTITKGFWMGQTAVTVGAWKRYAQQAGRKMPPPPPDNPGWTADQMPMVMVMWEEASGYCAAAGARLPTESEWEYAARAGTSSARYGNLDEIAWYADNSGSKRIDSAEVYRRIRSLVEDSSDRGESDFQQELALNGNAMKPVGLKRPNAWNLYDMLGNAKQWMADWYEPEYYSRAASQDPQGPPGDTTAELRKKPMERRSKVVRGGSWASRPDKVRASAREASIAFDPKPRERNVRWDRNRELGFRCVSN